MPTPIPDQTYLCAGGERVQLGDMWLRVQSAREYDKADELAELLQFIVVADFVGSNGLPVSIVESEAHRAWLTDFEYKLSVRSSVRKKSEETRRFIVEDIWPEGTIPFLTGQPKAGKSHLVVELIVALASRETNVPR